MGSRVEELRPLRFGFRASRTYKGLGHCFGLRVLGFKGLGIMGFRVLVCKVYGLV